MMCVHTPVTLAIADDHPLFVEGLTLLLKQYPDFYVAGTASNGAELLDLLKNTPVDIVITDLHMSPVDGFAACHEISTLYPQVKTLVLSFQNGERLEEQLKLTGARGFLNKDVHPDTLLETLRVLANGGTAFSSPARCEAGKSTASEAVSKITFREREIISLITKGFTSAEIAESLFLSIHTVSQHRKNILNKLQLKNVKELVAYGIRNYIYLTASVISSSILEVI